ncbi:MAG TPA: hypothetical protein VEY50_12260 [Lysobacter sp.]|nr:hypothetical protein [Lysobacter sp.]
MRSQRQFAGLVMIALAFAVIGLPALGLVDPLGGRELRSAADLWRALAPYALGAAVLFFAGLWLANSKR